MGGLWNSDEIQMIQNDLFKLYLNLVNYCWYELLDFYFYFISGWQIGLSYDGSVDIIMFEDKTPLAKLRLKRGLSEQKRRYIQPTYVWK